MRRVPLSLAITACLTLSAMPVAAQADEERMALGRQVFLEKAQPQCGLCHTLSDAGTDGGVGPVLDDLRPSEEVVAQAVKNGIGPMRPYTELSDEEIAAVAYYVATVTAAE
jgi:mono/diheme cytochrome c family protein